ncbi:penicillin-binding protein, beta-lactamase class C [Idiomarina sp. A28L]|uniref:serine hydrolase domain-containing protein n=1 Tax=Idiomarina sp. A28L TaxID=1036674 RepID=UPI000213880E|nr:serine hydrolase domain-containing protein [Idiomarina sp. A28L]EGN75125.1 penicillin-binding protein, beta-lactamase class C [Idiomarina sp. A28L]
MRSIYRLIITAALCVVGFAATSTIAENEKPLHPKFNELFQNTLNLEQVPGGVYAIVHRNQIVEMQAFGVRELNGTAPVDEHTVFRIASVSKTFAGTLASMLADQGQFDLSEPVSKYVPDLQFKNPQFNIDLEVGHLLAHSSGVVPNAYDNLIEANYPRERILPHFNRINPMCTPGACYGYQNVLFSLVEDVIAQKTGRDYSSLVTDLIFEPLAMSDASIGLQGYLGSDNRAAAHIRGRNGWFPREVNANYYRYAAAAGVNASATDLAQWLIAHMGYQPDVLPLSVLEQIRTPQVRTTRDLRRRNWRPLLSDAHYGLGWRIYDLQEKTLLYHGGWVEGFRAEISYSPDYDIGLVILINAESTAINGLSPYFWRDVLNRMETEQWIPYQYANDIKPMPSPLETPAVTASFPFDLCYSCLW